MKNPADEKHALVVNGVPSSEKPPKVNGKQQHTVSGATRRPVQNHPASQPKQPANAATSNGARGLLTNGTANGLKRKQPTSNHAGHVETASSVANEQRKPNDVNGIIIKLNGISDDVSDAALRSLAGVSEVKRLPQKLEKRAVVNGA